MNMRPETPLPQLTGLGIHAAMPGVHVTTADGLDRWLIGHDDARYTADWDREFGVIIIRHPLIDGVLTLPEEVIETCGRAAANRFVAEIHEALQRQEKRAGGDDEVVDPARVRLLFMAAESLGGAA